MIRISQSEEDRLNNTPLIERYMANDGGKAPDLVTIRKMSEKPLPLSVGTKISIILWALIAFVALPYGIHSLGDDRFAEREGYPFFLILVSAIVFILPSFLINFKKLKEKRKREYVEGYHQLEEAEEYLLAFNLCISKEQLEYDCGTRNDLKEFHIPHWIPDEYITLDHRVIDLKRAFSRRMVELCMLELLYMKFALVPPSGYLVRKVEDLLSGIKHEMILLEKAAQVFITIPNNNLHYEIARRFVTESVGGHTPTRVVMSDDIASYPIAHELFSKDMLSSGKKGEEKEEETESEVEEVGVRTKM